MREVKVYLPADLHQRLDGRASAEDRSLSGLIRVAARELLDEAVTPSHLFWQSFGRTRHVLVRMWGTEGAALCGRSGTVVWAGEGKACQRCLDQLDRLQREAEC